MVLLWRFADTVENKDINFSFCTIAKKKTTLFYMLLRSLAWVFYAKLSLRVSAKSWLDIKTCFRYMLIPVNIVICFLVYTHYLKIYAQNKI